MAAPTVGGCSPWSSAAEIRACCGGDIEDGANYEAAVDYASQIMFGLSGRQFPGECELVIRPCAQPTNCGCGGGSFMPSWWFGWPSIPTRIGGEWTNIGCCGGQCNISCIRLPWPINEVTEVLIDGQILDPSRYEVDSFRELCRIDGGSFPCSQDFSKDVTEEGTWQIEMTRGKPITAAMRAMATKLGCEFVKSICGAASCLPENVSSVARDGISIDFTDAESLFNTGKTGIHEIDLWLRVVNPSGISKGAVVLRTDDPARFRRWT